MHHVVAVGDGQPGTAVEVMARRRDADGLDHDDRGVGRAGSGMAVHGAMAMLDAGGRGVAVTRLGVGQAGLQAEGQGGQGDQGACLHEAAPW